MTLEKLLSILCAKGWKPRWLNIMWKIVIDYDIEFAFDIYDSLQKWHWNFRELVSKESWLWQFVCENEMVFIPEWEIPYVERNYIFDYERYDVSEFQYWLMVWALLKEDEIEQFLLDNIKVEW